MAELTRTWWIEGVHGEWPATVGGVETSWRIFNAPRPLPGSVTWDGEFHHGIFYAAIDPEDDYATELEERCISLDGHLVIPIEKEEVVEWCRAYYAAEYPKDAIDVTEIDYEDLVMSWVGYHEQFKKNPG